MGETKLIIKLFQSEALIAKSVVAMAAWTEQERSILKELWENIDINEIGLQAFSRLLIVYPWITKHFASYGDLSTKEAILENPKVAKMGTTVMTVLENTVNDLDNIKSVYSDLRVLHSEKLFIEPDNFKLLAGCITVCVAGQFGSNVFSPPVQEAWHKFLSAVTIALGGQLR